MPCGDGIISEREAKIIYFLCRACRHLTCEQLESIVREAYLYRNQSLKEWYTNHLICDANSYAMLGDVDCDDENELAILKGELNRMHGK